MGSLGLQLDSRALKRELNSWEMGVWLGTLDARSREIFDFPVTGGRRLLEKSWRLGSWEVGGAATEPKDGLFPDGAR